MLPFPDVPRTGQEQETLYGSLNDQRALMLWKIEGITKEQGMQSVVPSNTSLLGLIKHLAYVEKWWFLECIGRQKPEYPWTEEDLDADFRIEDDETVDSIRELYAAAVADSNAVIEAAESLDITGESQLGPRSLRWVIVHMIEETARHCGHADIIREQIDGVTGYWPDS